MAILNINPNENQYGLKYGYAEQLNLSGISVGTDDLILHFLLKNYNQEVAFVKKTGALQYFITFGDNTFADNVQVYNQYAAPDVYLGIVGVGNLAIANNNRIIERMYKNGLDVMVLIRELSYRVMINGHDTFGAAKAAHNATTQRLRMLSNNIVGGISTPGVGCLLKIYTGDLSGFSDADMLVIHRKYLRHPMITPTELAAYLKFKFTGRKQDGSQILAADTNVYNEVNGEALAIQGGLNWGQAREQVWQPR